MLSIDSILYLKHSNMKFFILIICFIPFNALSQYGVVQYKQIINLNGKADISNAILRFKGTVSLYQYGSQFDEVSVINKKEDDNSEHLKIRDEKGFVFYANYDKRTFLSREFLISKPVLVEDQFEDMVWNLGEANGKLINGQLCFHATGQFRGREYIAWYDPTIKYPFGPWKLKGLPGLILQAYSTDGVVRFEFLNFQKVQVEIQPPKERKKLSQPQYVNAFKRKLQSLEKFIKSNTTVSRTMSVQSTSKIHVLEISLYEN